MQNLNLGWLLVSPKFGSSARNSPPLLFQMALRFWMGLRLDIFPSYNSKQSFRSKCGKSSDIFDVHLSRCNKLATVQRHLVKLLMRYITDAHMDVVDEDPD